MHKGSQVGPDRPGSRTTLCAVVQLASFSPSSCAKLTMLARRRTITGRGGLSLCCADSATCAPQTGPGTCVTRRGGFLSHKPKCTRDPTPPTFRSRVFSDRRKDEVNCIRQETHSFIRLRAFRVTVPVVLQESFFFSLSFLAGPGQARSHPRLSRGT